jgi:RNA polymerase sigma factor (sigma-70 family)
MHTACNRLLQNPTAELFESFHAYSRDRLLNYCRRIIRHPDTALDVVQMAYLHLWNAITRKANAAACTARACIHDTGIFDWRSAPEKQLMAEPLQSLLRFANLEMDRCRKEFHREFNRRVDVDLAYELVDPAPIVREQLALLESSAQVRSVLEQLSADERIPFRMHYYEGRSHHEIAEFLRVDRSTVTRRISRALAKIRATLDVNEVFPQDLVG